MDKAVTEATERVIAYTETREQPVASNFRQSQSTGPAGTAERTPPPAWTRARSVALSLPPGPPLATPRRSTNARQSLAQISEQVDSENRNVQYLPTPTPKYPRLNPRTQNWKSQNPGGRQIAMIPDGGGKAEIHEPPEDGCQQ
ncbi:uncharacterized protein MELLADRAFT_105044 [Melampsora larici-populina 98AG31]|uniref:Uncharacterized protein n=1 Tax=Melampsora larici-populina (strain 98AG31 / pathotype 3-4-7) TaxID=747676 RepID=F4RGX2_MELLP|nr:uncharacterized protein MELLADRAFT_105044 [Melampsora larici-populina 98AG31]EGG08411.1 hypothetical protein MELLADRAFT_105044 [Melampsora larici-populina 98AG31]